MDILQQYHLQYSGNKCPSTILDGINPGGLDRAHTEWLYIDDRKGCGLGVTWGN